MTSRVFAAVCLVAFVSCSSARPIAGTHAPAPASLGSDVESVVQRQVDAYNRRDLDAFIALFTPDARLYEYPDKLLYEGHSQLRAVYEKLFTEAVDLRGDVTHRIVQGNFVIDREVITGMPGKGPLTGVAIYEVKGGRVSRVWFLD